jgi:type I restriction enzyme R subunit
MVLVNQLRSALHRLNPKLTGEALNLAIDALTQDRSTMSPAKANQEVYHLLKDGVKVSTRIDNTEHVENSAHN